MKKFLSNPTVALILTVVLCIAATLLNTRFRLGPKCEAVNQFFYTGAADGYGSLSASEPAIAAELRSLCSASEQLALLSNKLALADTEDAVDAFEDIREELRETHPDLGDLYDDYEDLLKEAFTMESKLERAELSEEDAETYAQAKHSAAEAKANIDGSSYNELARSFREEYARFPAKLLAPLSGVQLPQLFA